VDFDMEEASQQQSLLDWLIARYPNAKRQTLKRMVENGRVTVNGRLAQRLRQSLSPGDEVRVSDRETQAPTPKMSRKAGGLHVIYEDADLLVVHKPAGLLSSTVAREWRPTLLMQVREYVAQRSPRARVGLIHRLDRDASGLLVFSLNNPAYESLKRQFFKHDVRRIYMAVTEGVPSPREGTIQTNLVERADGSVHSVRAPGKGQRAVTEYKVVRDDGDRALVRITLQTGRKHQIRVHLAERGTPVVGDPMYGKQPAPGKRERLMLVAAELELTHPRTGKQVRFELPLPPELRSAVR
jgi:RluA family pseudouridine synthase